MFSIIVPVYNSQAFIDRCIQSILNMKYDQWELILVNDGSTDDTEKICRSYLYDSRIKLICQENSGVSSARNRGLQEAVGDYVLFMDADDYLDPNACKVFEQEMDDADLYIGGYLRHYPDGSQVLSTARMVVECKTYTIANFLNVFNELYKFGFINSPWAKCYRRELITGSFDSHYSLGEDLLFNLQYMCNCKKIKVISDCVYHYQIQSSGTLSSSLTEQGFQTLFEVYDQTFRRLRELFPNSTKYELTIKEKYLIDMLVMLERNIRYNPNFTLDILKDIIQKYNMKELCATVSFANIGFKWRTACRYLRISHVAFYMFIKVMYCLKKMLSR